MKNHNSVEKMGAMVPVQNFLIPKYYFNSNE